MKDSREKIFAAIRQGLLYSEKFKAERSSRSPLKNTITGEFKQLAAKFKTELKKLGGDSVVFNDNHEAAKFIADHAGTDVFIDDKVLSHHKNVVSEIKANVRTSYDFNIGYDKREAAVFETAISPCVACIAETGTVVIANDMRLPAALASKLFIIADRSCLLPSLDEFFTDKYKQFGGSNLFLITGPSRTADIEKQLVTGVHGPKEVYVLFIDDNLKSVARAR